MNKLFGTISILLVLVSCALRASNFTVEEKQTIQKVFDLSSPRRVEIDNLYGSIHVQGYGGHEVQLVAHQTIAAESKEKLQEARQEVRLDISQRDNTVFLYVDGPFRCHCSDGSMNFRGWRHSGYKVNFDFELKVPRDTGVFLRTVNDGQIKVENISGDYDVENINSGIEMLEVSGSGRVYALNGQVKVVFSRNPRSASSFGSLNGRVDLYFLPDLSADIRVKTFNGHIYSDFPVTYLPTVASPGERHNGKFIYKSDRFSTVRVGNGGPEIKLDGFNGDMRILQKSAGTDR
jgi:hypothetical protein